VRVLRGAWVGLASGCTASAAAVPCGVTSLDGEGTAMPCGDVGVTNLGAGVPSLVQEIAAGNSSRHINRETQESIGCTTSHDVLLRARADPARSC